MAYRPEWFPKKSILDIALDVVMFIRGSYETSIENHELDVKALEWVEDNWDYKYNLHKIDDKAFDMAVHVVITTALDVEEANN